MKFVVYYRVSTKGQGESGLGLDAQKRDVNLYLDQFADQPYTVLAEFTDVDSGSNNDRTNYQAAVQLSKKSKATLLVAKLDRVSRKVSEISKLMESVNLKVAVMPHADNFQLHIYAALAEQEREFISKRTKAALQEAKARGVQLGGNRGNIDKANKAATQKAGKDAEQFRTTITVIMASGVKSAKGMAAKLNEMNVRTVRGGEFQAVQVQRLMKRLGLTFEQQKTEPTI